MLRILFLILLCPCILKATNFLTPYELNGKNYSATYEECIAYFEQLESHFQGIRVLTMGETDAGHPLHLILLNSSNQFDPTKWHKKKHIVLLINNGIHPGEPDGIDASMLLTRDILQQMELGEFPKEVSVAIIPVYNIGGMLNRSPFYRVDQNGPDEFGSRGNSQNLDLNRDFIKCDSKEARSFAEIFHFVQPTIFMDNHVSDGADYTYTMTLASTQPDKLGGVLGRYLKEKMEPALFQRMKEKGFPMMYYVNAWGVDASLGWNQFFDSPRYSSGYAALFNTLSFVPETHMLKPYAQRVDATYSLMQTMITYASTHRDEILSVQTQSLENLYAQQKMPIRWILDEEQVDTILYAGYQYEEKISSLSGLPFKIYNRNHPLTKNIPFHNHYKTQVEVNVPEFYIIPQGWHKVIDLLALNQVEMLRLEQDTTLDVQSYYLRDYKSSDKPYEGHHPNQEVSIEQKQERVAFRKGDYFIPLEQKAKRFLVETLEPQAMDSYFSWNFFDPILNQKEGFTPYAYESLAADYVANHPELRQALEEAKSRDKKLREDTQSQLDFIYKHSPFLEPQFQRYPVFRLSGAYSTNKVNGQNPNNKQDE